MGHDGWAIVYILLVLLRSETNRNDLKQELNNKLDECNTLRGELQQVIGKLMVNNNNY